MAATLPGELANDLRRLSVNLPEAVTEITVPAYVLDRDGTIVWINSAGLEVFGDLRGEHFSTVVAPETLQLVREQFARKIVGSPRATSYEAVVVTGDGDRYLVDIDSVRLENEGQVVGVFGILELEHPVDEVAAQNVQLTPRQLQVLRLLAGGHSTDSIAAQLQISKETVRNHVRRILRALDAHSRLEAVMRARELGIV